MTDYDNDADYDVDDADDTLAAQDTALDTINAQQQVTTTEQSDQPIFQTLFMQAVAAETADEPDPILMDFAQYVVGPLFNEFGLKSAKGGTFSREMEQAGRNAKRIQHDQTMRAHLLNGMLPARRIAQTLHKWDAATLREWDETTDRLFIAGYMLHDYTKIDEVKEELRSQGFKDMEAPSERQISALEPIFRKWCSKLGLNAFLQPIGGIEAYLHELIYIAQNTQRFWGTAHAPTLVYSIDASKQGYLLATKVSCLADLIAYSHDGQILVHTPRTLVASKPIDEIMLNLTWIRHQPGQRIARLTYHHVAENRGVLLNFIHNAALNHLTKGEAEGKRVPLLYAPSGVVYLEHRDAPSMPDPADLIGAVVDHIRVTAATALINRGKGAKLGKDGLRVDSSYGDFLSLPEVIPAANKLAATIRGNAPQYVTKLKALGYPHCEDLPPYPEAKDDPRFRRMAEWASLVEIQFEERWNDLAEWFRHQVLERWEIGDLTKQFDEVRQYKPAQREGTGIRYHWYWAAIHALNRHLSIRPEDVNEALGAISDSLVASLPTGLPPSAQVNQSTWDDLADYIGRVLTLGGTKAATTAPGQDITRYTRAKAGRGGAACAICGSAYRTRKPAETAVAFQPGVYTARI
ncbi:MAG: type I-D CRISPR-associated protein Cas10d/Csc3, partial [Anaerolineae bacterium]|nr:type I-D CRISPR-associated protein Cas10d/Csc3 [Anaerolineae bacterium]